MTGASSTAPAVNGAAPAELLVEVTYVDGTLPSHPHPRTTGRPAPHRWRLALPWRCMVSCETSTLHSVQRKLYSVQVSHYTRHLYGSASSQRCGVGRPAVPGCGWGANTPAAWVTSTYGSSNTAITADYGRSGLPPPADVPKSMAVILQLGVGATGRGVSRRLTFSRIADPETHRAGSSTVVSSPQVCRP